MFLFLLTSRERPRPYRRRRHGPRHSASPVRWSRTGPLVPAGPTAALRLVCNRNVLKFVTARTHHVGLPQGLAHAVHLLRTRPAHHEVLRHHRAADQVQGADERLEGFWVQSCDHRLDVVRPEPENETSCLNLQSRLNLSVSVKLKQQKICFLLEV